MRPTRTAALVLLPLLFLLPAIGGAQTSPLAIERHTALVDSRDAGWFYRPDYAVVVASAMSQYLVDRIADTTNIAMQPSSWTLERDPFLFETSVPGNFAAGDARRGSSKRVAAAVGEGSATIGMVHEYLRTV